MAIFGKNGLYAAALYIGGIWLLYGRKSASFKDTKEIDNLPSVKFRKTEPSKSQVAAYRRRRVAKETDQKFKTDFVGTKSWVR